VETKTAVWPLLGATTTWGGSDEAERPFFSRKEQALRPSVATFRKVLRRTAGLDAARRSMSLVVALLALFLCAPLMLVVSALIKLDSPGPVFFVQWRAGRRGRPFRLFKFRTMLVTPAGAETSPWVADNEHRITRVGRWLRRLRLDELPQFFNILKGDMNLVGPRPHPLSTASLFRKHFPCYRMREFVRPGLTGLAQIRSGYANGIAEETQKVAHDLYYVSNATVWMDLRIICQTPFVVLTMRGM
jgi:UDP-GalNAc:undecaprenyl-phosphate GalNAc-1-phosphate transferase